MPSHVAVGHWPQYVESLQRVELRGFEASPKVFSGLSHACCYRAPTLHCGKRINDTIRPPRPTGTITNRPLQPLDWAMTATLWGRS
jgi:hypothetical protein